MCKFWMLSSNSGSRNMKFRDLKGEFNFKSKLQNPSNFLCGLIHPFLGHKTKMG